MAKDLKKLENLSPEQPSQQDCDNAMVEEFEQPIKTGCAIKRKKTIIYYKRCIIPLSEILTKRGLNER